LVDGAWIDRYVVELAEWSATLLQDGFQRLPAIDEHPLAWDRFYPPETHWSVPHEATNDQVAGAWEQVCKKLATWSGRTKYIDGRLYLHFDDYLRWPKRGIPGELEAHCKEGLVISSWNAYLDREWGGGEAQITPWVVASKIKPNLPCRRGQDFVVYSTPE